MEGNSKIRLRLACVPRIILVGLMATSALLSASLGGVQVYSGGGGQGDARGQSHGDGGDAGGRGDIGSATPHPHRHISSQPHIYTGRHSHAAGYPSAHGHTAPSNTHPACHLDAHPSGYPHGHADQDPDANQCQHGPSYTHDDPHPNTHQDAHADTAVDTGSGPLPGEPAEPARWGILWRRNKGGDATVAIQPGAGRG